MVDAIPVIGETDITTGNPVDIAGGLLDITETIMEATEEFRHPRCPYEEKTWV